MTEQRPFADAAERLAIEHDLGVTMLVEAAAGTGKTTSLVTRIAALVREGKATMDHVAAITFTVHAAAQLRERVHQALEEAAVSASGEERERLDRAVKSLDRAFIGTTHAFCARLLRERPVEAGLDPDFEELDAVVAALRTEEFWSRWFEAQTLTGSEELRQILEAGVKPKLLRTAFLRLVDYPDVEIVATPCARPELRQAVDAVLEFVAKCEPSFPDDSMREKQDEFEKMMRELARKRDASALDEVAAQLEFLEVGNHVTRRATLKNWADGAAAKRLYLEYQQLASTLVRPTVTRWREYVHCLVVEFLEPAVRTFEEERQREGTLTFNDLLLRARDLLRDHPNVRKYFQSRFTHVLVDEFQDTDPIQAEVLFYLTGEDVNEKDWRKLRPRSGSLFIVGDPKQSIYRFRRADITTYLAVRERMERVVPLRTNFRSMRAICDFVNATFPSLFTAADVDAQRQAAHVDLDAVHEDRGEPCGVFVLETPDGRYEAMAEAEAACIARWIRAGVDRGEYRFGDFLLVSSFKKRLAVYARALEQLGIRYEITGGEAFPASRDLRTAMPLLRAVADPDDPVALTAFLRGPLCGATDQELYDFVRGGGRFNAWSKSESTPPTIERGLRIVRDGIDATRDLPPAAAMARVLESAGVVLGALSGEQAGTRSGNVMLALAMARKESAAGKGFGEIVAWLEELLDAEAKIEELDVDPGAENVVRLMNLHQVKGLEGRVVFLVDPVDDRARDPEIYVDRSGDVSRGYVAITEPWGYSTRAIALPQEWERLAEVEKSFLQAERKRLLYVAATRARQALVIGVAVKNGERRGVWSSLAANVRRTFAPAAEAPRSDEAAGDSAATPTVENAAAEIASRLAEARKPSYSVLPVTKVAHDTHEQLVRAEEGLGKGTSWGRVLHRIFEALVRQPAIDVRAFAENMLKDEERDPVEVDEVVSVVEAVRASTLWSRLTAADERYVEVPFALMVPRADVGLEGEGETLLHGLIDLVFREGDRWLVVDYKSDSTAARLDALVAYYRPQVEHYVRFWQHLTKAPAAGALFFTDGATLIELGD